jgi:hypothetical protein
LVKQQLFLLFFGILGVVGLVGGFISIGSPATRRDMQQDETRLNDFAAIYAQVNSIYYTKQQLPESLEPLGSGLRIVDPYTQNQYEYRLTDERSFVLCTTFTTATSEQSKSRETSYAPHPLVDTSHDKGYDCIEYAVDVPSDPPRKTAPQSSASAT